MSFFDELFKKKDENKPAKIPVKPSCDENKKMIENILKDCDDVIYREFYIGQKRKIKCATVYAEGLVNTDTLNEYVLENLMDNSLDEELEMKKLKEQVYKTIKDEAIAVSDVSETNDLMQGVDRILSGDTVLIVDQWDKLIIIASKGWPMRGINPPSTETVIRGSSDGFVETMRINTALVRRRIRDPKFKIKQMQLGRRSKTDIAILYIEETVNKDILKEVKKRLDTIDMDAILESGYIEQLIEDQWRSPFPQIQSTQRPDVVAAALYEGRVGIIVDNTPFVLLVPATIVTLIQSPEDYSQRFFMASALRILRFLAILVSLLLPSFYIAITSYHPGMLPTDLALYVAGSRANVPFPAFIEAFIMQGSLELLREAGLRLPGPIGGTIGIVGGLVLGQAAVEAGIVSPLMVIVVALTALASNAIPNYSITNALRVFRFMLMGGAAVLGLYGMILGGFILLTHLCNLKSFGVPFLTPFVASEMTWKDFKDAIIRVPLHMMKNRPQFLHRSDNDRFKSSNVDDEKDGEDDGEK